MDAPDRIEDLIRDIAAINGTDLNGSRHFEVARILKEIPIGSGMA